MNRNDDQYMERKASKRIRSEKQSKQDRREQQEIRMELNR